MPRLPVALFVLLVAATTLLGCGSSGGGADPTPEPPGPSLAPTVTNVVPNRGPISGSTPISVKGTNFIAGATVTVGGTAATSVSVTSDTTITCTTPAGTAGAADVTVTTTDGSGTMTGAFTYNSIPVIVSVAPKPGSTAGGTPITILGANFQADSPGPNTVTIGGVLCAAIITVDDNTITCTTPAGTAGAKDVVVTNGNGTDTLTGGFSYAAPLLYVAEGAGAAATLAAVNPVTLTTTPIGPVGFSVTGLALGSDGTLYGAEALPSRTAPRNLLVISPVTGAGTALGPMADASLTNHVVPGMTFVKSQLVSVSGLANQTIHLDTTSGQVTVVGPTLAAVGGGLAMDPATGTVYYGTAMGGVLQVLNPNTGMLVGGPTLVGGTFSFVAGMAYLGGTLYAIDKAPGPGTGANLVSINTTTGVVTTIMALPVNTNAIANSVH